MKVLHLTTYNEECGIAKFNALVIASLDKNTDVESVIYQKSLNVIKNLASPERAKELKNIVDVSSDFDAVHIQHEFGLFFNKGEGFSEIVDALKSANKKIVVTIHTAPSLVLKDNPKPSTPHPRKIVGYLLRRRDNKLTKKRLLSSFLKVDKIITFNENTQKQLVSIVGVREGRIYKTLHPIKKPNSTKPNKHIRSLMGADKTDTILSINGFVNQFKGFDKAVRALSFLPENYKLAILGGTNPDSGDPIIFDNLCDLVQNLGLGNRVYISGYVEDDLELEELIQGCDISLYPYDVKYYSLASSGAAGVSITANTPIVAYPAPSFLEINEVVNNVIKFTLSATYFELVNSVKDINLEEQKNAMNKLIENYSYDVFSKRLSALYAEL